MNQNYYRAVKIIENRLKQKKINKNNKKKNISKEISPIKFLSIKTKIIMELRYKTIIIIFKVIAKILTIIPHKFLNKF